MTRFVVGDDRSERTLFPERLEDICPRTIRSGRSMSLSRSCIWPGSALAGRRTRGEGTVGLSSWDAVEDCIYGYCDYVENLLLVIAMSVVFDVHLVIR